MSRRCEAPWGPRSPISWGPPSSRENRSPTARLVGMEVGRGGEGRGRFCWKPKEEGFLGEVTFRLDLERRTRSRRKNILEAEQYPNDRETLSMCEPGQISDNRMMWPVGPAAPQTAFRMEFIVLGVGGTEG